MLVNTKLQYRLLARNTRYSFIDGITFALMQGATVPYLGLYILRFGGSADLVSLIAAIQPVVLFIGSLLAASYVNRFERKKDVVIPYSLAVRLVLLLIAAIPLLPGSWYPWALFVFWGLMYVPWAFSGLSWSLMISNIVPDSQRGSFFGTRNAITGFSTLVGTFLTGLVLARMPFLPAFTMIFVLSFISTMISQYFLTLHMEPVVAGPNEPKRTIKPGKTSLNLRDNLLTFQHPLYGRIFALSCVALFVFHIGYSMAIPLYMLRQVKQLGFDNTLVALITTVQSLTALVGSYIGGRSSDRWGYRYVFLYSTLLSIIPPLIWAVTNQLPWLILASLINGLAGNAYMICFLYMVLAHSPYENRSRFVAVNTAIGNLAGTIGPLLGMFLIKAPAINIQGALIIAAVFMLSGSLYAFRVAKDGNF
ncbi:putative MFS family arabinose efflux permease [Hydrogenispora ethanolica]|jgi:MFS family permease|uniref:Putative MFS family arabinose efflux permease n=1 Tax=Hydrogenispora ethanolica TaxID=1082276 RepID=A0A4V2QEV0_HYDET|nr:MFS transporter [Hydrogenispora ethanolica]TCL69427.1 putative MFS family arabinose efflux permease [Hydrogenispora ethanolica]